MLKVSFSDIGIPGRNWLNIGGVMELGIPDLHTHVIIFWKKSTLEKSQNFSGALGFEQLES